MADAKEEKCRPGMRWRSATVSWLGFLALATVVVVVGLLGNRHIVVFIEEQFIEHASEHSREVGKGLLDLLRTPLVAGAAPAEALVQFRPAIEQARRLGVTAFVYDTQQHALVAHTNQTTEGQGGSLARHYRRIDGPDALLPEDGEAEYRAETTDGRPLLIRQWQVKGTPFLLGVEYDLKPLIANLDRLHWHVDATLLATEVGIVLFGFLAMRRLGRAYESHLEGEVRARTRELEETQAEMVQQASLATIGQTAAMLTHEMRNPLAALKLGLSGMIREELSGRSRRRLDIALREVDRLDALLAETLDYVRPVEFVGQPESMDTIVDRACEVLEPLLAEQGLILSRSSSPDSPVLQMDGQKMQQVVLNLLKNAAEASEPGGEIGIKLYREDDSLVLDIRNGGEPIRDDIRERVFDLFFTTKPTGTGLGLGFVRRVVVEHGGTVSLTTGSGSDTLARIMLPIKVRKSNHLYLSGPAATD
ncbi:ATP-binding protein [endosymbiont of Riftia pachyptila]|nr:ATP-binding protein [endosymbiont of Riftia pachyptila]